MSGFLFAGRRLPKIRTAKTRRKCHVVHLVHAVHIVHIGCGASNTNRIEGLVGASNVQDRSKLGTSRGLRNSRRGSTIPRSNRRAAPACPRFAYSTRRLGVIPLHVKISPRCMPFAPDSEVLRLVARGLAIPPHRALLPGARDAPRLPNCSTGKGYMRKATCSAAEAPYVKGRSYA